MSKPASAIDSWKDWPQDVMQILRSWNHASVQRLRFSYTQGFVCYGCGEDCRPNRYGDAVVGYEYHFCDECLIDLARHESRVLAGV